MEAFLAYWPYNPIMNNDVVKATFNSRKSLKLSKGLIRFFMQVIFVIHDLYVLTALIDKQRETALMYTHKI